MATSYEDCYDVFLSQLEDPEILYPFEDEAEDLYQDRIQTLCFETFKRAIPKFTKSKTSLARNDMTESFVYDLRPLEIEIIGLLMLKEYYRSRLNFLVALKHSFSDKDWKSHDKSNQMNQYRQLLKETDEEIRSLTISNSYLDNNGRLEFWE